VSGAERFAGHKIKTFKNTFSARKTWIFTKNWSKVTNFFVKIGNYQGKNPERCKSCPAQFYIIPSPVKYIAR